MKTLNIDATGNRSSKGKDRVGAKSIDDETKMAKDLYKEGFRDRKKFDKGWKDRKKKLGSKNDPAWYNRNPELTRAVCNLPFTFKNGLEIRNGMQPASFPTLLVYHLLPTLGGNIEKDSLSTVANNLYSWVRFANSGSRNYEAPDLFMYLGAIASVYALVAFVRRNIAMIQTTSVVNRALPIHVIEGCGIDYDDLVANSAIYRGRLNALIARANAYNVPDKIYLYQMVYYAFSNVFIDSENPKDLLYTTKPAGYLSFDGTSFTTGSALKLHNIYDITYRISDYLRWIEDLLGALETNEDIGIMSGDLLKISGLGNRFILPYLSESEVVAPVFSKVDLLKLKNMRVMFGTPTTNGTNRTNNFAVGCNVNSTDFASSAPDTLSAGGWVYHQYNNAVVPTLYMGNASSGQIDLWVEETNLMILDSEAELPTADEINEDTAFSYSVDTTEHQTAFSDPSADFTYVYYSAWGPLICVGQTMILNSVFVTPLTYPNLIANIRALLGKFSQNLAFDSNLTVELLMTIPNYVQFTNFTWTQPMVVRADTLEPYYYPGILNDVSNVHILSTSEFLAINDAQLLSIYAIPANSHLTYNKQ